MAAEYVQRIGQRIKERRDEKHMTQLELARALPGTVGSDQVSRWERGLHKPSDETLEQIAEILDVPVVYFMTADPDKTETPDLSRPATVEGALADILRDINKQLAEQNTLLADIKREQAALKTLIEREREARTQTEEATKRLLAAAEAARRALRSSTRSPASERDTQAT